MTTLTTPGGKPTSSARLARWSAVRGVCSAGCGTEIRGKVLKEISGKTIFGVGTLPSPDIVFREILLTYLEEEVTLRMSVQPAARAVAIFQLAMGTG